MDAARPESSRAIEESSVEEDAGIDFATPSSALMSGTLFVVVVGVSSTASFKRGSLDSALEPAFKFSGAVAIGLATTEASLVDGAGTVGPRVLFLTDLAFGADVTGLGGKE